MVLCHVSMVKLVCADLSTLYMTLSYNLIKEKNIRLVRFKIDSFRYKNRLNMILYCIDLKRLSKIKIYCSII